MSMTTKTIDLQKFCEPESPHLENPSWIEGMLYASNGRLCVRVPADKPETANHPKAPAANKLEYWWSDDDAFAWESMPPTTKKRVRCDTCNGIGQDLGIDRSCPKCGNHDWPCEDCEGEGSYESFNDVVIGGFHFGGRLIDLLSSLPNPLVNASEMKSENHGYRCGVLRVKFDGGQAILVGLLFRDS